VQRGSGAEPPANEVSQEAPRMRGFSSSVPSALSLMPGRSDAACSITGTTDKKAQARGLKESRRAGRTMKS